MLPTKVIKVGTTVRKGVNVKDAISEDLGKVPACYIETSIDTDFVPPLPDNLLSRQNVETILKNPAAYGLEIPNSESLLMHLNRTPKGSLLMRDIGRLHFFGSVNMVAESLRRAKSLLERGLKEEKERGTQISSKNLTIITAMACTGTGSALPVDLVSIEKYLSPDSVVILVTSFSTVTGSSLPLSQHHQAKKNASELLEELIAIKNGRKPNTFFPYLKDFELQYQNFTIPVRLPDYIFNVVPRSNSLQEILETMSLLIKDLCLYGVPLALEGIENVTRDLENVISVTADYYRFPAEKVENWIVNEAFRSQIRLSLKTEISRSILAEVEINEVFEVV